MMAKEIQIGTGYYRDTGCSLYPSCLKCPLPECRYDTPSLSERMLERGGRNAEIRALRADGCDSLTLERWFGVSRRTIYRIIQKVSL